MVRKKISMKTLENCMACETGGIWARKGLLLWEKQSLKGAKITFTTWGRKDTKNPKSNHLEKSWKVFASWESFKLDTSATLCSSVVGLCVWCLTRSTSSQVCGSLPISTEPTFHSFDRNAIVKSPSKTIQKISRIKPVTRSSCNFLVDVNSETLRF